MCFLRDNNILLKYVQIAKVVRDLNLYVEWFLESPELGLLISKKIEKLITSYLLKDDSVRLR